MAAIRGGLTAAIVTASLSACSQTGDRHQGVVEQYGQDSGVTDSLRGLAVVDADTAWIGAPDGQVLHTTDGGETWAVSRIADAAGLDLRSAHGFDAQTALFATAGQPARIYRTDDGAASFRTVWDDATGEAFFDSMAFWNDRRGLVFSDPVAGDFLVLLTDDGGETWQRADGLPDPLEGEAGFAASNTSIAVSADGCAWIGTGGGETARVLRSCDWGSSWSAHATPLAAGSAGAGIFSLYWDGDRLFAAGGNYQEPETASGTFAWSDDRGETWHVPESGLGGYRSAITGFPIDAATLIATGPTGSDNSRSNGESWGVMPSLPGHHAIGFAPDGSAGWAIGSEGRITRFTIAPDAPHRD